MSIAGIGSSQDSISFRKSSHDSYENNIKKQITALEEKMKTISSDDEIPAEEKKKERQAAQEQLQNLNQELREYQIRKRQEEAAKKQEATKEALAAANTDKENKDNVKSEDSAEDEELPLYRGLSGEEAGIMITLSTTKEHLDGLVRVRKNLEGKQRTADTEEEKAELQKKINRVSRGIGQKVTNAKETVSDLRKSATSNDKNSPSKAEQKTEEISWIDTKQTTAEKTAVNRKLLHSDKNRLFNDNISIVIK